ncbi:hypothetical protein GCK72_015471 [Caenorhabditis remanei]|uniref:Peptidase S72 domain-containing protein n=1 Tax=Caenorhabditis remanei TaxID=31234 RepID=A0A6A5GWL2_CAERE|nr:hypothetical protein GCK72_015471 [Caenorhabditis remanei]KAF1759011.1 hypothetical protein GCK72_015471 [Caenorhabditis remanei]
MVAGKRNTGKWLCRCTCSTFEEFRQTSPSLPRNRYPTSHPTEYQIMGFINTRTVFMNFLANSLNAPGELFTLLSVGTTSRNRTEVKFFVISLDANQCENRTLVELLKKLNFHEVFQRMLPHFHIYKVYLGGLEDCLQYLEPVKSALRLEPRNFHSAVPDQKVARAQFARLYPEYKYLVIDEHVYFVCVIVELVHVIFLFSCFFRLGLGMITVILLIWMPSRSLHRFDLSTKTRMMHMQLIRSLCYQISVPILAFYGPVFVVIAPLMFTIPNTQISSCISLLFMSFHTFLGTISMLYFNRHYRHWLISAVSPVAIQAEENANKELEILEVPAADHQSNSDRNVETIFLCINFV